MTTPRFARAGHPLTLRFKLAGAIAAVVFFYALFSFFFYPNRMETSAQRWAERRAVDITLLLSRAVRPGLEFDAAAGVGELLASLAAAEGSLYAAIYRDDGSIFAVYRPESVPRTQMVQPPRKGVRTVIVGDALHVATVIEAAAGTRGMLVAGFSLDELRQEKRENRLLALVLIVAMFALGVGWAIGLGGALLRPITVLTRATHTIVESGDLTHPIETKRLDEVGVLAVGVSRLVASLAASMLAMRRQIEGLSWATEQLSQVGTAVSQGIQVIRSLGRETAFSMQKMQQLIEGTTERAESLKKSAGKGSASIAQMATTNASVAASVGAMTTSVQQTSEGLERLLSSTDGIAKSIADLNNTLVETSTFMLEIDSAISEVDNTTRHTAQLSAGVSKSADEGVEALRLTLEGIARIEASSRRASEAVRGLEKEISRISEVVGVIDDVTGQTNLLALNAAIIAAQAGEQGRGFSVVADEIKSLAERTRDSTGEIGDRIADIKKSSHDVVGVIASGVAEVREGIVLGEATETALQRIRASSTETTLMVQAMSYATRSQSEAVRQITDMIRRIADSSEDIAHATRGQGDESRQLAQSISKMKDFTEQVDEASRVQSRDSQAVSQFIDSVTHMMSEVGDTHAAQAGAAAMVLSAMEAIQGEIEQQGESTASLKEAIARLQEQADDLRREIDRFRV